MIQSCCSASDAVRRVVQTRTIRNAVNLHKKTINLTPVPGEPQKLYITFAFDATDACVCVALPTVLSLLPRFATKTASSCDHPTHCDNEQRILMGMRSTQNI